MAPLLKIERLSKSFGGLKAVNNFNLELQPRQIQGLIGPNGAGKTTVFNLITGVYQPDAGNITLENREISRLTPDAIARAGIARTFQNIRLFSQMTVLDNVKMAFNYHAGYHFWEPALNTRRFRHREQEILQESLDFLNRFGLANYRRELAGSLPYGEQRRLEIARALATGPKVLLLDEPAAGMNPNEVAGLIELLGKVHRDFPVTILLIEHQMPVVMELCGYIQVIDFGQTIAGGGPDDITNNPLVIKAYLGEEAD
jgi:branched-chain amino acid transport system ATP-binding protein